MKDRIKEFVESKYKGFYELKGERDWKKLGRIGVLALAILGGNLLYAAGMAREEMRISQLEGQVKTQQHINNFLVGELQATTDLTEDLAIASCTHEKRLSMVPPNRDCQGFAQEIMQLRENLAENYIQDLEGATGGGQ